MRRFVYALTVAAAVCSARGAVAQEPATSTQILHLYSGAPGQEVSFRMHVDRPEGAQPRGFHLLGSSAAVREGEILRIATPAQIAIPAGDAFRVSFRTTDAAEHLRVVVSSEGREVHMTGSQLVFVRAEAGGAVHLESAEAVEVRRVSAPSRQP